MRQKINGQIRWWDDGKIYEATLSGQFIPGRRVEFACTSDHEGYQVVFEASAEHPVKWKGSYTKNGAGMQKLVGNLYGAADGSSFALTGRWPELSVDYRFLVEFDAFAEDEDSPSG
jgi:hypothetical protein